MDTQLTNRAILVTGASGGIGAEVVRSFYREGARVIAHGNSQFDRAQALAGELGTDRCIPLQAELTDEAQVEKLFAEAEKAIGPIEVLVANAGKWPPNDVPIHQMELEQWNGTLAANLTSVFLCIKYFFRGIAKHKLRDPAAVLVGSTAAMFGEAGHADYSAAKAALTYGLVRTLKNEMVRLAPRGRINVVCPGWVFTPMTRRFADDKPRVQRVLQTIPLRKVGRPDDIARTIVFLSSSDLAGHITGQIIPVTGGMEGRVLFSANEIDPEGA